MDNFAEWLDRFYRPSRDAVFRMTRHSPEKAHEMLIVFLRTIHRLRTHKMFSRKVADGASSSGGIEISNAAGFNKNAEIPPRLLYLAGFDRVVIGTVCKEPWQGNPKPRCVRFEETQSMVNWLGLPGVGSAAVRNYLESYRREPSPPLTLNVAPTPKPGTSLKPRIEDVAVTIKRMAPVQAIDRIELNVSCPNVGEGALPMGKRFLAEELVPLLETTGTIAERQKRDLYLKISPDLSSSEIEGFLETIRPFPVKGVVACNTGTKHPEKWILRSPGIGGASGEAVYEASEAVRRILRRKSPPGLEIIACGGINSIDKVDAERRKGIREFQLYTPLIFQGFVLISRLKRGCGNVGLPSENRK